MTLGQSNLFEATEVTSLAKKTDFDPHFNSFKLFNLNLSNLNSHLKSVDFNNEVNLKFNDEYDWEMLLYPNEILSKNYKLRVATENGIVEFPKPDVMTFYGYIKDEPGSTIRLTVKENFVYGFIRIADEEYFIEPARKFQSSLNDGQLVVYKPTDVKSNGASCGVTETSQKSKKLNNNSESKLLVGNCYETELAVATDYSYYQDRGSDIDDVVAYSTAVMNNVGANYELDGSTNFDDGVEFKIVEHFVVSTSGGDPWTTSTDPDVLLPNFRSWAGSGFSSTHDLGQLWTDRDLDGSTIGYAYIGVVCGFSRYHILQDYSMTAWRLKVLTTHEIGHNFDGTHDGGSGFIMSSSIGGDTDTWSSTSQSDISAHIVSASGSCLGSCAAAVPVSDFYALPRIGCEGGNVFTFYNASSNQNPVTEGQNSWSWTFTGGTPSSSTDENPQISYSSAGTYDVTLTATNGTGAGSAKTKIGYITVLASSGSHCDPTGSVGIGGIQDLTFAGITHDTGNATDEGAIYLDYFCDTDLRFSLDASTTYTFVMSVGDCSAGPLFEGVRVYIDYNNDNDFSDSGEEVATTGGFIYCGSINSGMGIDMTTPTSPLENIPLRMRIVADNSISGPCDNITTGQVQDYSVIFENALPIELLSFTGNQNNESILLDWKTSTEVNNDYFTLEHSIDGYDFEFLAEIDGKGNSTTINDYRFVHLDPTIGTNYYRLSQTDFDGTHKVADVIAVDYKSDQIIASVIPNPIRQNEINLRYTSPENSDVEVEVIDMTGKVLIQTTISVSEGENNIQLPTQNWSGGVYYLRTIQDQTIRTIKFVKTN